jgi:hypothetical protein
MSRAETGIQAAAQVGPTVRDRDLRNLERDGYAVIAGFMSFG